MSGPQGRFGLMKALGVVLLVLLGAGGARAQGTDCNRACAQLKSEGTVVSPQDLQRCVQACQKLQEVGAEGISIKCAYELPKLCGYELGWDLIRYCFKPCIEFKKEACEDCLVKHGFCGAVSICRSWVCKCFIKNQAECNNIYHKSCNR